MKREAIPGWIFIAVLALASSFASKLIVIGGKNPVEAAVIAIIVGILLKHFALIPNFASAGVKAFEKPLILGIVLIGASLNFTQLLSQGLEILFVVLLTMIIGLAGVYMLGKLFKLSNKLALLLTVGTTICGGTAIAITAPLIKAKEEETSYAIGTIAIWGLFAILLYPLIASSLHIPEIQFGIFAGTAIHSTPQVVGAGFIYSDLAGRTATAVKLVRNCFIAPVTILITLIASKQSTESDSKLNLRSVMKAFPWFLFGYFILAGLNTADSLSPALVKQCTFIGKFLILMGMVGVGLNSSLSAIKSVGMKPLLVGLFGALCVAVTSIASIYLLIAA